jgi:membrane-associated protein
VEHRSLHAASVAFGPLETAGPVMVWVIVLSLVFVECAFLIGLFLPGDSLLFTAGVALAAQGSVTQAWLLSGATLVVAVGGNYVGYEFGRRTGTRVLARRNGTLLNRRNLRRAERFFERSGFWALLAARWIPWIRTLAPVIAGAASMDRRRYLGATVLGALCWVPTLVLLGYYGAGVLDVLPWLRTVLLAVGIGMFVAGTVYGVVRYRQEMRKPIDDGDDDLGDDDGRDSVPATGGVRAGRRAA